MEHFDPRSAAVAAQEASGSADPRDRLIAALEGRLRALEYVINNLPEVTAQVLHKATQDLSLRQPIHPLESNAASETERMELAERAMTEIWRQKR